MLFRSFRKRHFEIIMLFISQLAGGAYEIVLNGTLSDIIKHQRIQVLFNKYWDCNCLYTLECYNDSLRVSISRQNPNRPAHHGPSCGKSIEVVCRSQKYSAMYVYALYQHVKIVCPHHARFKSEYSGRLKSDGWLFTVGVRDDNLPSLTRTNVKFEFIAKRSQTICDGTNGWVADYDTIAVPLRRMIE